MLEKLNQARGCLAGLAIGDALGRPVEGLSIAEIEANYGEITQFLDESIQGTDDTEFAILTATTLIENGLNATADDFADSWRNKLMHQTKPLIGAGFSELSTLRNLRLGLVPPSSGFHSASWSDGLAMRVAPIGIAAHHDAELACKLAISDGEVSNAGEGIFGGIAVALAVALAMNDCPTNEILEQVLIKLPENSWLSRNLKKIKQIIHEHKDLSTRELRHMLTKEIAIASYPFSELAPEAVALAFATLLINEDNFEEALLFAVNLGRDTDTIAAICGAVLGAKVGYNALPNSWTNQLKPALGSCLEFSAGIDLVALAPELLALKAAK